MATTDSIRYVLLDNKLELKNLIENNERMSKNAVEIILFGIEDNLLDKKLFNKLLKNISYLIEIKALLMYIKELYPPIRILNKLVELINYIILYSEIVDYEDLIKYKATFSLHDLEDVEILDYVDELNNIQNELIELKTPELIPKINDLIVFGLVMHIKKINKFIERDRRPLDENMMDQIRAIKNQIRYMKNLSDELKPSLYYKLDKLLEHNRNLQHKKHKSKWSFWNRNGGKKYTRKNRK